MIELFKGANEEYFHFVTHASPFPEGEEAPVVGTPLAGEIVERRARMLAVGYTWHVSPTIQQFAHNAEGNYAAAEQSLLLENRLREAFTVHQSEPTSVPLPNLKPSLAA